MTDDRTPDDDRYGSLERFKGQRDYDAEQAGLEAELARADDEIVRDWVDRGDADLEDREAAGEFDEDCYPHGRPDVDR